MSYVDLDAKLAELHDASDEPVTVHLGGADHEVVQLPLLEKMRLGARFLGAKNNDLSSDDMAYLADLLPRLIPTAKDYLEHVTSNEAFQTILGAALNGPDETPSPSPGGTEGNGSTASEVL